MSLPQSSFTAGFQFRKRSQYFFGVHNEAVSVVAMCVNNPDCSPVAIHCWDAAQTRLLRLSAIE
jgi:hypothetical protein